MLYEHKDGVNFRKIEERDLRSLLWLKHESWWGTHKSSVLNIHDQQKWFENIPSTDLYMAACKRNEPPKKYKGNPHLDSNKLIGVTTYTDIDPIARTMYIGGSVSKEFRSHSHEVFKGGTDFAFEILNAHRLNAEVVETQYAALKIDLDTLGFTYEGRRRKAVYKCGRYYDSIHLGLLREEWNARREGFDLPCNRNFDIEKATECKQLSAERCPPLV